MDPALAIEVAAVARQRALLQPAEPGLSDTQQFYTGTRVFLTGASGFMGKQLSEKLLRSCNISKLYILLRPKKGKTVKERLETMLEDPVFSLVREQQPSFAERIVPIEGDAAMVGLGISEADWANLAKEVEIIYHLAATTRFDEDLKTSTFINVRGTREVIKLSKACVNLKSYVHVSSSYAHALKNLIKADVHEQFYGSVIPPQTLIDMAEHMPEERFISLTEPMIKGWPNTYTFTKAVSEDLIRTMTAGLPVSIVRPGIVVNTYHEPMPGWLDMGCAYGASGIVIGIGLGVVHCFLSKNETRAGMVPCDYVNNAIIVAGKETITSKGGEHAKIYTVNSIARNPIPYGFITTLINNFRMYPSLLALYYNFFFITSNKLLYNFTTVVSQLIPAYIADFVVLLMGKKPRFVKLYKKTNKMLHILSYFTLNDWNFCDTNTVELYNKQSKTDKFLFNFDIADCDMKEFLLIWGLGVRKYIIKDGLKGTVEAVRKQNYLRYLHYFICALYLYVFWKIINIGFGIVSYLF